MIAIRMMNGHGDRRLRPLYRRSMYIPLLRLPACGRRAASARCGSSAANRSATSATVCMIAPSMTGWPLLMMRWFVVSWAGFPS